MAKWSVNLEQYAKVKKKQIEDIRRSFVFLLYANVVKRTPIDTGRARGNWAVTSNTPSDSIEAEAKTARHKSVDDLPVIRADESAFITNNLPYINTLEYGGYPKNPKHGSWVKGKKGKGRYVIKSKGGFSKQAPNGMVGVTVAEANRLFKMAVSGASR